MLHERTMTTLEDEVEGCGMSTSITSRGSVCSSAASPACNDTHQGREAGDGQAQAPTSVAGVIGLDRNVMPFDGMEKVTTRVGRQLLITIR
ncbi:hypothetical protein C0Q70_14586 [Pomacea canaliculata]|uniref:Uncharacterized protein n=1 Tax=Pomacea canaliculata TaxID=400727 RepID=A0A2T7NSI8_POMCA|nr:hypothetical protein C0Q70_14586 [Pomacea canaliculata]